MTLLIIVSLILLFVVGLFKFGFRFFRSFFNAIIRFLDNDYDDSRSARHVGQVLVDLLVFIAGIVVIYLICTTIF